MRQRYKVYNGAIPSTGPQVRVTLTNAQKTQLQITAPSTGQLEIVEWGCSFDGSTLQAPVQVELLTTATVAGTGQTAVVPTLYGDPNTVASNATAGFTPTAEGTIVTVRMIESEQLEPIGNYKFQYPLGERPIIAASQVVRIRTNTAALTAFPGFIGYIVWLE